MRSRSLMTTVTVALVAHVHHRSSSSYSSSQWHLLGNGARASSERYRGRCSRHLQLLLVLPFTTTAAATWLIRRYGYSLPPVDGLDGL